MNWVRCRSCATWYDGNRFTYCTVCGTSSPGEPDPPAAPSAPARSPARSADRPQLEVEAARDWGLSFLLIMVGGPLLILGVFSAKPGPIFVPRHVELFDYVKLLIGAGILVTLGYWSFRRSPADVVAAKDRAFLERIDAQARAIPRVQRGPSPESSCLRGCLTALAILALGAFALFFFVCVPILKQMK